MRSFFLSSFNFNSLVFGRSIVQKNCSSFSSIVFNYQKCRSFAYKYKYNLPYNNGRTYILENGRVIHYEGPKVKSDLNKPEHIGKIIAILKRLVIKADSNTVGIFKPQFISIKNVFEERFDVYFPVKKFVDLLKSQLDPVVYSQLPLESGGCKFGFAGYQLNKEYFFDRVQLVDGNYSLPIAKKKTIKSYLNSYTEEHFAEIEEAIAYCLVKSESDTTGIESVLTIKDLYRIQAYLKTQPIIGTGDEHKPEFASIVCSKDHIKKSILNICDTMGLKCVYGRFRLGAGEKKKNLTYAFKHIKLNPRIFGSKSSELNTESNTSEDNH